MRTAVYFVRRGRNEELRYSLRTVEANLPEVEHVVIIGDPPRWARPDLVIPGNPHGRDKWRNVWANVYIAATWSGLDDDVVMMNDDFFVLRPTDVRMYYRSRLATHMATTRGAWHDSLRTTHEWLQSIGVADPLSYELHRPFPMNRDRMRRVMDEARDVNPANPPQWRTIYGNRWAVPAEKADDVKLFKPSSNRPIAGLTFASTDDAAFPGGTFARYLRRTFPKPSRWEA